MDLNTWVAIFVILASISLTVQSIVVIAAYVFVRRRAKLIESITREVTNAIRPIPPRIQAIVEQVQARIPNMLSEAEHITRVARSEVQHADRVISDAMDRFQAQVTHADRMLTTVLDSVEQAGSAVRREVSKPVRTVVALARGVQAGVRVYRGNHREAATRLDAPEHESESYT